MTSQHSHSKTNNPSTPLNVLIFEYVTGGGFSADDVPESLASEGRMMVKALLSNFATLQNIDVCVINQNDSLTLHENFRKQIQKVDAVWVIAPEFDHILETFCSYVEKAKKNYSPPLPTQLQ